MDEVKTQENNEGKSVSQSVSKKVSKRYRERERDKVSQGGTTKD